MRWFVCVHWLQSTLRVKWVRQSKTRPPPSPRLRPRPRPSPTNQRWAAACAPPGSEWSPCVTGRGTLCAPSASRGPTTTSTPPTSPANPAAAVRTPTTSAPPVSACRTSTAPCVTRTEGAASGTRTSCASVEQQPRQQRRQLQQQTVPSTVVSMATSTILNALFTLPPPKFTTPKQPEVRTTDATLPPIVDVVTTKESQRTTKTADQPKTTEQKLKPLLSVKGKLMVYSHRRLRSRENVGFFCRVEINERKQLPVYTYRHPSPCRSLTLCQWWWTVWWAEWVRNPICLSNGLSPFTQSKFDGDGDGDGDGWRYV